MFPEGPYTKAVCAKLQQDVRGLIPLDLAPTVIAGALNNGHGVAVGIVLPDGRRHAIKARGLDPIIVADMLTDWIAQAA